MGRRSAEPCCWPNRSATASPPTSSTASAASPTQPNPHLFINRRSALYDKPVNSNWLRDTLGMAPKRVLRDRIFDEAFATDGDLRQLTDLFGVSVATADRFATWVHRARAAEQAGR